MNTSNETDKRGRLEEEPFSYSVSKEGLVLLAWHGRTVMTLSGDKADKFLARVADASTQDAQLAMAKLTGNFKRGNEKTPKRP